MVQILTRTRTRTLSFSVREAAGRQRPSAEEPDAKRARHHAPLPLRSTPLAPKSVNLTVTAVPVPFPADADDEWGTDKLPTASTSSSSSSSRGKKLVAKTTSKPLPQPPVEAPLPEPVRIDATRARLPSPLAPYWKPAPLSIVTRQRRGKLAPEPLARKAVKAHFAQTPHGAAVIKLGARRAIAQAECVAAVERVRKLSGEKEMRPTRLDVPPPVLLPPVLMDADLKFEETKRSSVLDRLKYPQRFAIGVKFPLAGEAVQFPSETSDARLRFPAAVEEDSNWVPLSVQSGGVPVEMEECDIVEMDTDGDWSRS
ncbi:unnamed protein product [Rhizoctonia solani]|uniref:Uncharacterized protein n=1 Tax=Rhizoctonia solani TaxID=456999 RepID=A0A8H3BZR5_9AGAM|nr:unnamed protein product [Rhizoctonia solani]